MNGEEKISQYPETLGINPQEASAIIEKDRATTRKMLFESILKIFKTTNGLEYYRRRAENLARIFQEQVNTEAESWLEKREAALSH
jgi:geranylgeranyl pyrophosphate synthase